MSVPVKPLQKASVQSSAAKELPHPANLPPAAEVVESAAKQASDGVLADFDGNWLQLASNLKLAGMAGMLATHCELKSFVGNRVELSVPVGHKHLAEKSFIDKLQAALNAHFGVEIFLRVTIGESSGNSLVEVESRERQAKQAEAVAAIGQDNFVRELVENLDARLIESSIRPIQQ